MRERQKRNMLATLLLAQGTPMLLAGDEFGRTQNGNNNAYCQDNELNWIDWESVADGGSDLIDFVRKLIALRRPIRSSIAAVSSSANTTRSSMSGTQPGYRRAATK